MPINKLISVVIPTYKRSEFLIRSIESVFNQTYKNIEVIVVDDNGDNEYRKKTKQRLKEKYSDNDRLIYIENSENIGAANSRNRGAGLSKGEYLCFLDDDDVFIKDKLETQYEFMEKHGYEMSFSDIKMYDQNEKLIDVRSHKAYVCSLNNEELLVQHILHHLTPTDAYMFTREGFKKSGGFADRAVSDEWVLMLNAILNGVRIGYLEKITAIQYIHTGERISSGENRIKGDNELLDIKKRYFDRLSFRQKRYVYFRHNTALAVYLLRNRQIFGFMKYAAAGFFSAPIEFIREGVSMWRRIMRIKHSSVK